MGKWFLRIPLILLCFVFIFSCRPAEHTGDKDGPRAYPCERSPRTDIAWIVLEWNGRLVYGGYGSGFLVDRKRGLFFTNKHVSDMFNILGKGSHKIFFNCEVYNAKIIKTPPLADAALIQITGTFDYSKFPDPVPFAKEKVKVGDTVTVEGFHPHPYWVREADKAEGYQFPLIPIFRDYYNLGTKDLEKEREVVFEHLDAVVVAIDKKIQIGDQGSGIVQELRDQTNLYLEIRTRKDHKFPFSGLSGTAVRNKKGEIIGIFTAGPKVEYDPETKEDLQDGSFTAKLVFQTAYITPIELVEKLRSYPNEY